jgi:hypothetical protein
MTTVFIVRPFGTRSILKKDKETGDSITVKFDFDKVETDLIKPAMAALNLEGGTTGEVFEAGEIKEDMFSQLLLADIVIADITIYNANVFYELGIRHALRDKRTILIKCPGFDDTPFDIIGYRYISYEKDNPAEALPALKKTISDTMDADRKDSPVFNMLPGLVARDIELFLALPKDFIEELSIATAQKSVGKLSLMADEAGSFSWEIPALRLAGKALFDMECFAPAKIVLEKIKRVKPADQQANELLATVYQRLAQSQMVSNPTEAIALLAKSNMAIEALLQSDNLNSKQRAEAYALKARNTKTRWLEAWKDLSPDDICHKALLSQFLKTAFENYERGFYENLNHYYSGINALGLLITIISLAERCPGTWTSAFSSKDDADIELRRLKNKLQRLSPTVQLSIESARATGQADVWLNITEADFICLTSTDPSRVGNVYAQVLQDAGPLGLDGTLRQLKIYEMLGIKPENTRAAIDVLDAVKLKKPQKTHCILFTGHMIDKPGRPSPRFPASEETGVKERIKEKVLEIQQKQEPGTVITGIAGGACGGDILFHEICESLNIPTQMYLAVPREKFIATSVAFAGNEWIDRFDRLFKKLPHPILSDDVALPKWLQKKPGYNIWIRNNLWELNSALANGGINTTLVALWDGKGGDGAGGTQHMVDTAKAQSARVEIVEMGKAIL